MKRKILLLVLVCSLALLVSGVNSANHAAPETVSPTQQHTEIKIDPKLFDEFVGQYSFVDDPDFVLSFWREGDRFFLEAKLTKAEIFSESETKFFLKVVDAQVTFVRAAQGKVTGLIWHENNRDSQAKKISDQPDIELLQPFDKREEMIPMRDGVRLHTLIFTPHNGADRLPILLNRTPYGVGQTTSDFINRTYKELVKDGYSFVRQDIRGRYGSEGQFVMNRPPRDKKDPRSIDESTDTYDTIDWLVRNVARNNGRVGVFGVSYGGWLAAVATLNPHPALKAASPQAPMTDTYLGDDFFHNGAFRQTYGYEYVTSMESSKENTDVTLDKPDAYDWYLGLGSLSKINDIYLHGRLPTWNAFVEHPNYDDYWKARASERYLTQTPVPTLVVGGWWDQEDLYGTLATYEALERHDREHKNFLVLGPWNHGGWNSFGRTLGNLNFGSPTGLYYRREIQAPWFAYFLKDKGKLSEPEAVTFQTGSNKWTSSNRWPPKEAVHRNLFLRGGKKLSFEKPVRNKEAEFESYVSDVGNPVPYRKRPIQVTYGPGSEWYTWLVQDQRFLHGRTDVLAWQTDALENDLTISGDIVAHLFASTTGSDSDWVVKLIDVYPDDYPEDSKIAGYQLMIADEIFRGRFRKSFEKPAPIVPNEVNEYVIDLHGSNHCFKKGHRVMIQIQSTWFPLYDRNPQNFVENIFKAQASDYQVATQRVYESARYPSHVTLPVMKSIVGVAKFRSIERPLRQTRHRYCSANNGG